MTSDTPPTGRLLLIPNTLDLGSIPDGAPQPSLHDTLPLSALQAAARLQHWVTENAKTTRALLKRVDAIEPLRTPLQQLDIQVLPRPPKGTAAAIPDAAWDALLAPARAGQDIGLMSEAGLPGVADPGAGLVLAAHRAGIAVLPISGPSSLVLAIAGSGLNGQSFAFQGYLPTDATQRTQRIKELELLSRKQRQTQLVIETPYRNDTLFKALLQTLQPETLLSVACGLTLSPGWCKTLSVARWRRQEVSWPDNLPAVFSWLAA
ncbi:MAG TPA: SAM-dependent methyltransferase [Aquabacterium sp.]|uniref:SAM-dependent methyltransferase n=1 Tax=Aquabacterium sp. TaxID=1872578 RepID=UPI002E33CC76|nr:SAM-dependent methyltransferase [Aquabacterium sp.]HEX5373706.1 SAM-dependent methyltransferase [Aquabacterium sp.]